MQRQNAGKTAENPNALPYSALRPVPRDLLRFDHPLDLAQDDQELRLHVTPFGGELLAVAGAEENDRADASGVRRRPTCSKANRRGVKPRRLNAAGPLWRGLLGHANRFDDDAVEGREVRRIVSFDEVKEVKADEQRLASSEGGWGFHQHHVLAACVIR